jgi:hypothetical protein
MYPNSEGFSGKGSRKECLMPLILFFGFLEYPIFRNGPDRAK